MNSLIDILKYNIDKGISLYRISSDIIPFASHPINEIQWWIEFNEELSIIKKIIKDNQFRVSMHPGQYTVLNSNNEKVVNNAIDELEYHGKFLDTITDDFTHKIVLHIGGVYGNKDKAMGRFISNFSKLSSSVKNRLIIENDERNYKIDDVLYISKRIDSPVVFDNLHNEINGKFDIEDIFGQIYSTWKEKDGTPKFHYSQQAPFRRKGSHTDTIEPYSFIRYINRLYKDVDMMLEVKDKNISTEKIIKLLSNDRSTIKEEWGKYKYNIMGKSYNDYKKISEYVNSTNCTFDGFIDMIYITLNRKVSLSQEINTLHHIWGYFKKHVSSEEKDAYFEMIDEYSNGSDEIKIIKQYIFELSSKYKIEYLLDSYYFNTIG